MPEEESDDQPLIAIIGAAGRFPGAPDVETFWANLAGGREGITDASDEELLAAGVSPAQLREPGYVRAKGVLADADLFDAGFFGFSPREAEMLDPQHRVFLECAWEALESAGCDPQQTTGRIGLFAGASLNSYLLFNVMASQQAVDSAGPYQTLIASDKDFLATRVSYKLGLRGPSITVQTACSTSLTAVHLACQSLLSGECDIALAGGVSVSVPLKGGYRYEPGGILSPDGHCRAFDADAAGTVAGNGTGIVVLRRLAEAREHGDMVAAVIRGTAVNNDGSLKAGYTAPSVDGQAEVIAEALAVAGVDPETVGYVEAHGTGTPLGDPIEIAALTRAFREHTDKTGFCAIGSVKSSVGHLDAAAGVTALIKATLALQREAIPATLNYEKPNPDLALDTSPFFVNTELRPWPRQQAPRRAGVSSFGIGGTNVHVVLEEAPASAAARRGPGGTGAAGSPPRPPRPARLLPLSARTGPALAAGAGRLADHLDRHPGQDLGDVAWTLASRRRAFEHRASAVCRDRDQAIAALRRLQRAGAGRAARHLAPVAFLFPGQGAQYAGMARGLYQSEPVFTAALDECAGLFAGWLGTDLRTLLFPPPAETGAATQTLAETAVTQPVIFMVEYALARQWCAWGVRPHAMAGHSIGEYTAACLAGVFTLPDAVRLVAARGRLVQEMPRGAMLAVGLPEAETAGWLRGDADGRLCLAAVNSATSSVVSGPAGAVAGLHQRLTAAGVACRLLHTSHAFHSASMAAAVGPFTEEARAVRLSAPQIPFCSNVTGTWITDEQATSPEYWGMHLRQPVRFAGCLDELLRDPDLVLLEVGPGQTLSTFARQHRAGTGGRAVLGSLRHPKEQREDPEYLLRTLGDLWNAGVPADWAAFYAGEDHRPVPLPGYSFQRQRYWVTPDAPGEGRPRPAAAAAGAGGGFYAPGWKRLPARPAGAPGAAGTAWAVLGAELGLGRELASELAAAGATVARVSTGDELISGPGAAWSLDVTRREHYARLIKELDAGRPALIRVVHLWSLAAVPDGPLDGASLDGASLDGASLDGASLDGARRLGLDSLLALAQGIIDARPAAPVAIDVLCRGIHSVTGEERLQPENATLLGACTVIPQEVPDVTCRSLDITGTDPDTPGPERLHAVRSLLASNGAGQPTGDTELALRGRHWWARTFDAVQLGHGSGALRDGAGYLITGGLGGIGLELAEYIARHAAGPVLGLLGRSPFPAADAWDEWLATRDGADATSVRIRRLRGLADLGAQVVVLRADVTDRDQMRRAAGVLRDRSGPIHGVIHAAGVPSRGLIAGKERDDLAGVLAAKTHGTLVLDEICGQEAGFMLLCSSVTSVLGGPGQSDYGAANAFLDAFAQWKRQETGTPVTAVGWDTWRGVGMAAGLAARLGGPASAGPMAADTVAADTVAAGTASAGPASAGPAPGHPLLQRLARTADESQTYVTTFSTADSWIVGEHRIQGHGLVPGTAYLELVRAAVTGQAGGRAIELRDVLFTMPVIVPDGQTRDVYTTIGPRDGQLRFTVQSRAAAPGTGWQEHASGAITFAGRDTGGPRDLAELRSECEITEVIETEDELKRRLKLDLVEQGGQMQFSFGPRWRCLRRIETGGRRLMVTLQLGDAFLADLGSYALHPALLDVAGAAARIHARDVYYLPFTYRSVRILSPLTSTVYCRVQLKEPGDSSGETLTCDIDIYDPQGLPLVLIAGFAIKRINDIDGMLGQIERSAAAPAAGDGDGDTGSASTLAALSEGMSAPDATEAFGRILAAPSLPAQILVAGRDLTALRGVAQSITPALLAREVAQIAPVGEAHPRPELDTPYVEPATDDQRAVAAIWADVLGIDRIGLDDDFFALGGHSLAAVQIGAKIQSRFGAQLELRDFFDSPTVASTAALLSAAGPGTGPGAEQIQAIPRDEPGDLDEPGELDGLDDLSDDEVDARLRELLAADMKAQGEKA